MINNRYEFTYFIQAKNANPNGDPDFDNAPRTDSSTGHGYIADVALKRDIRDYVNEAYAGKNGYKIIMQANADLNKAIFEIAKELSPDGTVEKAKNSTDRAALACKKYFDVRAFGAVLSTGKNAGQIKGPVQFEFADSIDEIEVKNVTITRVAYDSDDEEFTSIEDYENYAMNKEETGKRDMGRKYITPFALYRVNGYISANQAHKTGFNEEDLNILFESILNSSATNISASKAGMNVVGPIIIFKHVGHLQENNELSNRNEALLGCYPAHLLFESISVNKKENVEVARDYKDYDVFVDLESIPSVVKVGFKYTPFEDIIWDNISPSDKWIKTNRSHG